MSRFRPICVASALSSLVPLLLSLNACNGSHPLTVTTAKPAYKITATGLNPGSVIAGNTSISNITVTPINGYTGKVTLSCESTGAATPAPTCSFSTEPVMLNGTVPSTSTLTVSTSDNTPGGSYSVVVTGKDAGSLAPNDGPQSLNFTISAVIQHVVVIFQENRTPDNLFHDPVLIANGADIATIGLNSSGATIALTPTPLGIEYDLSHSHGAFLAMYDNGRMDGADHVPAGCATGATNCPPPNPQFMYVQPSDVAPYFQLAEQYTFGDRMFQTNQGPSFPAHQFIISGTSAPSPDSTLFASENTFQGAGCAAVPGSSVSLIDPSGKESSVAYPCFEHPTLTDELEAKGVSWRYYAPNAISIWTAPNAIQHMCGPNAAPPNATACVGSDWVNNVVLYTSQNPAPILNDISNHQLASVSWVIPAGKNSDHAGNLNYTGGPSWVASIVNAIGASPYWSNTAIIITWDDWGGWYDHVPPPKVINDGSSWGSGYVYGFRVPLIVVSPYAKAKYISHATHDFGSILNFIEHVFGLPSLGYADARADDLSDCFNFTQNPTPFQRIAAPLNAEHFLHDQTPAEDPDDD